MTIGVLFVLVGAYGALAYWFVKLGELERDASEYRGQRPSRGSLVEALAQYEFRRQFYTYGRLLLLVALVAAVYDFANHRSWGSLALQVAAVGLFLLALRLLRQDARVRCLLHGVDDPQAYMRALKATERPQ